MCADARTGSTKLFWEPMNRAVVSSGVTWTERSSRRSQLDDLNCVGRNLKITLQKFEIHYSLQYTKVLRSHPIYTCNCRQVKPPIFCSQAPR